MAGGRMGVKIGEGEQMKAEYDIAQWEKETE